MIIIPTFQTQAADFIQEIELEGILVRLRIVWNSRSENWYLNSYEEVSTGNRLLGIKMVTNFPILLAFKSSIELPGNLFVLKSSEGTPNELTYDNLSNGWNFAYLTSEETEAWRNENGI